MSQHHRAAKWSTHSPKLRKIIDAQLPLPCVDCGQPVMPGMKYQVGHRPGSSAASGAAPTIRNVGPSHVRSETWPRNCNQINGGKAGAAVTNRARARKQQAAKDIRPW